ncbi:MAG TPA: STAS domain-containing protein [Candidatus Baltobacteraceae bacterium]|nr:STAS domain-containing protein [Candidatus Baltobacteraceae bacterium]
MEIQRQNGTLNIAKLDELTFANARDFRKAVEPALDSELKKIEVDLSQMEFVDGGGLGALLTLYRTANEKTPGRIVSLRLLNPQPPVLQMLELTQMRHLFEIVTAESEFEEKRVAI